jgi:outer membrane receptor for ferrienterochelin and colicins
MKKQNHRHISVYWIFSFLLYSGAALGQDLTITFKDRDTHEPVVGLAVLLQSIESGQSQSILTDDLGRLRFSSSHLPVTIHSQHLGYEPLMDTLDNSGTATMYVVPKTTWMKDVTIESDTYQQSYSTDQDLFFVEEMDKQTIDNLGGNDLSDVLNFSSNINVELSPATGRSTISLFGLDGQYVKVLVDNMPMISDNGLGNNVDISQINLDNVERIEVSEGAMGVMYGSNAVAGVVNIITKKGGDDQLSITARLQEETVGSEYNWKDEGRHIQSVDLHSAITPKLRWSLGANHDHLMGFKNELKGRNYYGQEGTRGYEWNPREQLTLKSGLSYDLGENTRLSYEYNYFQQNIDVYDTVLVGGVGLDGLPEYKSNDRAYRTQRHSHRLNFNSNWKEMPVSIFASYQQQSRDKEEYTYDLERQVKTKSTGWLSDQSSEVWYSKGMISNVIASSDWVGLTAGYEIDHQKGYDAVASGNYSDRIAENTLTNLDFYSQLELFPVKSVRLTPGIRLNRNSQYKSHLIWSLSGTLYSTHQIETKLVVGSAYRTPSYSELFYYFVDANHDVQGNPELSPEDGVSVFASLSKKSRIGNVFFKNELQFNYFDIKDKIGMAIVSDPADPASAQRSTYLNINQYQNLGLSTENRISIQHLSLDIGASYYGIRQSLEGETKDQDFRNTFNLTSQASYLFARWDADASINLKYTGQRERYSQNNGSTQKVLLAPYTLLNTSIRKRFFAKTLEVQLGARNLLNVVSVNASGGSGGHGGSGASSQLVGYGRSYFIKLQYTFRKTNK